MFLPPNMFSVIVLMVTFPICFIAGLIMLFCGLGWWSILPMAISVICTVIVAFMETR